MEKDRIDRLVKMAIEGDLEAAHNLFLYSRRSGDFRGLIGLVAIAITVSPEGSVPVLWTGLSPEKITEAYAAFEKFVERGLIVRLRCGCYALRENTYCLGCAVDQVNKSLEAIEEHQTDPSRSTSGRYITYVNDGTSATPGTEPRITQQDLYVPLWTNSVTFEGSEK